MTEEGRRKEMRRRGLFSHQILQTKSGFQVGVTLREIRGPQGGRPEGGGKMPPQRKVGPTTGKGRETTLCQVTLSAKMAGLIIPADPV